ncbi:M13 family metallopeptidase [Sphingomonas sp.]|uniref:M13 family metallopeptidase n=1 Tax=Sphingomonas sp. TaxID=28214 RepID=UPI0025F201DE|nr:M13 family metallopeptidase [Sphingomonas sp.]
MRTKLIALLLASAVPALAVSACKGTTDTTTEQAAANKSGLDLAAMDKSVKPGDDFFLYANGTWFKTSEIPADRGSISSSFVTQQELEKRMDGLMADIAKSDAAAGTNERKLADFRAAYMDQAGIDQRTLPALKADIDRFEAIADKKALATAIGSTIRADVDPLNATTLQTPNLFGIFVTQSMSDPSKDVPYLLQGGIGLPDRDYYTSPDPEMAKIRDAYKPFIAKMLAGAGLDNAEARSKRVYDLEAKIAAAHATIVETEDSFKANNPWTQADFAKKAPGLDWGAFFQAAQLSTVPTIVVWHAEPTRKLAALVASEPLDAWKDWLAYHQIIQAGSVLPTQMHKDDFAFFGTTLGGTPEERPRDKQLQNSLNALMGDAVGQLYVAKYFPASEKADIDKMVSNIKAAFDKRIEALDWIAPATKKEARAKVSAMLVGVGYPDKWRDYSALEIKPDDAYGNLQRAGMQEYRHQLAKLGQAPDRGEWWMVPQIINAVNLPLQDALNFPAGILQPPFYHAGSDPAANYGAIGAVMGHEISHSFDNLGSTFDSTGKLRNWWTPADLAKFNAAGQALVAQYDAYEVLPGLHIKGRQVLAENIADVAGLAAAYDAYKASLGGRQAPVIDGFTGDQRFFIAYAQGWASKMREATMRGRIATDGHSPGQWRALTVRNIDAWYTAFDVKPGDKLYLAPEKRVKVW